MTCVSVKNWSNHFLSRIKLQFRGPFWENLFWFFLLFNLRWAQLYVSLVWIVLQIFLLHCRIFFCLVDEKSVTDAAFQERFLAHELVLRFNCCWHLQFWLHWWKHGADASVTDGIFAHMSFCFISLQFSVRGRRCAHCHCCLYIGSGFFQHIGRRRGLQITFRFLWIQGRSLPCLKRVPF